jgi:diguanylate cyclase (GGDEF)-like protein
MTRLSIPTRNRARVKHPRAETSKKGVSPAVVLLYLAGSIVAMLALRATSLPPAGAWGGFIFFAVFMALLLFFSIPATGSGFKTNAYISFDRLAQVAMLLLFGPAAAAWGVGAAMLAYMLVRNPYREAWRALMIHALGVAGMYLLATLAGGLVYAALGGEVPLRQLGSADFLRVCVLILSLQMVNDALLIPITWSKQDGRTWRKPIPWSSSLTEVIIAFTGLVTAFVYSKLPLSAFVLYVAMLFDIAILLKIMTNTTAAERRRAQELGAVNRVIQAVDSAASIDDLLETIFAEIRGLIGFKVLVIGLYDPASGEINIRLNYDQGKRYPPARRKLGAGVLAWTIEHQQSVMIADARTSAHPGLQRRIITGEPAVSIMNVPIIFKDVVVGVISLQDYRPRAFGARHLELLEGFAQQIAVAITNARLFTELQENQRELETRVRQRTEDLERTSASLKQAMEQREDLLKRLERENRRDPLTGLANRRHLQETLSQEHYRARRFGHPLALAMGDLDYFKDINDRWGHAVGDEVLKTVARLLGTEVRATDLVARYGGEEFVMLLPETSRDAAFAACEKLRARIGAHDWSTIAAGLTVTMSFGVAASVGGDKSRAHLMVEADSALYQAKSDGRNCVRRGESTNA